MIDGDAISLLPLELDQLEDLWKAADSKEIWEFTSSRIDSKDEMMLTIEKAIAERDKGNQIPFAVFDKEKGRIIGSTRFLEISDIHKTLEIGWTWYHPEYWRTRVNTETKFLLLKYAFEEMGNNRIQFCTDLRNVRSQKAIARIGAKKEGTLRKHRVIADGFVRDTVVFSIIKDEWPAVKAQLQEKLMRT
ncbi:MAG TPA: GNAT family N-acetyltransferase [Bacillus bacterium]|nr:GNAT family N-acetyltransferase [Bacillus sp. (in: firmicutes)]